MSNVHTCPIRSMNLFMAEVMIMHSELVKVFGNMIGCVGVDVPITIVVERNSNNSMRVRDIVFFKMMPTPGGTMSILRHT
jgi:hypothetical protein